MNWSNPIATGAWSIGNEIVFYIIFGVLNKVKSLRCKMLLTAILLLLSVCFGAIYFSSHSGEFVQESWAVYTNPIFQLKFFLTGILLFEIYNHFEKEILSILQHVSHYKWAILITGFLISNLAKDAEIISGFFGTLLFAHSVILFISFIYDKNLSTGLTSKYLFKMGTISYSLYLCHPIVFSIYKGFNMLVFELSAVPKEGLFVVLLLTTFIISSLSYRHIEAKFKK
jgi:peptidoglycan/LPS O-acetylase OafA/YrhL